MEVNYSFCRAPREDSFSYVFKNSIRVVQTCCNAMNFRLYYHYMLTLCLDYAEIAKIRKTAKSA